jgi:hypothetical protein
MKPNNYWTEENIIIELRKVSNELGHFPVQRKLRQLNRNDIDNAIISSKKPYSYYREKLGYKSNKPRGFWHNEENIIEALKELCLRLGHFPCQKEMQGGLHMAVFKADNSIQYYQKLLGYEPSKKPIGYWTEETLKKELIELTTNLGYFPTQTQLKKLKRADITKAIDRIGITYHQLQSDLGFLPRSKPKNYWKVWDNLVKEIESIISDERFPTLEMIGANLSKGAICAIMNFGGINEVATKMGYDPPHFTKTTDGHMVQSSYEYRLDEWLFSKSIAHTYGGLISIKHPYRYDFKLENGTYVEIWGYEKDRKGNKRCNRYNEKRIRKEQLYTDLGLPLISIESDVFRSNKEKIEKEFERLFLV